MKASKTERLLRAIAKTPLSAKQIKARFDIPNVSAVIYDLRRQGFDVRIDWGKDRLVRYSI